MTYAFDTLGYARRLRDAGVTSDQAEAHAEAARDFIMAELVTKSDLLLTNATFQREMASLRQEMDARFRQVETAIENQTLRMTVRLGGMVAVAVAILAAINKL